MRRRNDRDDNEQDKRILGRGGEPDGQCGGICWNLALYAAFSGSGKRGHSVGGRVPLCVALCRDVFAVAYGDRAGLLHIVESIADALFTRLVTLEAEAFKDASTGHATGITLEEL